MVTVPLNGKVVQFTHLKTVKYLFGRAIYQGNRVHHQVIQLKRISKNKKVFYVGVMITIALEGIFRYRVTRAAPGMFHL